MCVFLGLLPFDNRRFGPFVGFVELPRPPGLEVGNGREPQKRGYCSDGKGKYEATPDNILTMTTTVRVASATLSRRVKTAFSCFPCCRFSAMRTYHPVLRFASGLPIATLQLFTGEVDGHVR